MSSGSALNYAPVGSGAGIKAIEAGKGDFGASDVSLSKEDLDKFGLVNFPVAISGVVPIVNLPSVPHGELKLTGAVLADILGGTITQWNAPQIAALNHGMALPDLPIVIIGRADGSGTTYVISNYLAKVSEEWAKHFGNNLKIQWPASAKLATGTSGMLKAVAAQPGAIGYAEWGQAEAAHMHIARVANQQGNYPAPERNQLQSGAGKQQLEHDRRLRGNADGYAGPRRMADHRRHLRHHAQACYRYQTRRNDVVLF